MASSTRFFSRNFFARSSCLLTSAAIPAVLPSRSPGVGGSAALGRTASHPNYIPSRKTPENLPRRGCGIVHRLGQAAQLLELVAGAARAEGLLGQLRPFA